MDTMCALLFLTCVHVALSVDVINVIELQPGELVSGNVSLKASDTYSVTQSSTVVRPICMLRTLSWYARAGCVMSDVLAVQS